MAQTNYNMGKLGIQVTANTQQAATQLQQFARSMRSTETQSKQTTYAVQKMAGSLGSLGSIIKTQLGFGSLQQGLNTLKNAFSTGAKEAIEFVENYNLFNVSMRGNVEEQLKFQYALNNAFKTNMSETLRYQGFFANLSSSLGITNEATDVLSQNLTKLTYDLSSLFNVDVATIYSKLQSGIVGQTKPLRTLGIDVTMQTLQPYLDRFGIDKKVTELTQAEKVLLRYIAILDQSQNAQGDFARTIETSANQLRILKLQTQEMARWFGTMLEPAIRTILPYLNALVMTFKEIFKWISLAMGFDLSEFNFLGEIDTGNAEEDINGVNDSVEKLKKSLYGFDEINNVTTSVGTDYLGLDGTTSTYDKLLLQLKGYDNLMSGVQTKADLIAKDLLSWLGFTQDVNSETGEISYTFNGIAGLDFARLNEGWKNFTDSGINFARNVGDYFKNLYDNFFKPLGEYVIQEALPTFLDNIAFAVDAIGRFYEKNKDSIGKFLDDFLLPLSKLVIDVVVQAIENIGFIIDDLGNYFDENEGSLEGLLTFLTLLSAASLVGSLGLLATPMGAIATAIGVFILAYDKIKDFWKALKPADSLITSLLLLAAAVGAISIAVTGGISVAPIMAGIGGLFALLGVTGLIATAEGFADMKPDGYNMGIKEGTTYDPKPAEPWNWADVGKTPLPSPSYNPLGTNTQNTQTTVNINLDDVLVGSAIIDSVNRAGSQTGKTIMAIE
jgi:hypothetical protein